MVIGEVDIGIIPATITPRTPMTMVYFCVYLMLIFVLMKMFISMKQFIVVVITEDVDLGIKIPATLPLTTADKGLMMMGEADKGSQTRPTTYHNPDELGRSLGLSVNGNYRSGHMFKTIHLPSYKHGGL